MTFRGRRVQIDWGHLVVLCLISGATVWYLLDARSVSPAVNNLLLVEPLSIAALILCAFVVPQCFHYAEDGQAAEEPSRSKPIEAADLMQPKLPTERVEVIKMLAFGGLLGLFVFSLTILGFDIAIFLFCAAGMAICGERRPLPLLLFPLAVTVFAVYGFKAIMPYPMMTTIL